mmetsp:Transcript_10548/g.22319  ORF Transcript_10548/g.22319 Transcript_10548/m.22319 type:complete len:181 (-) Transcript_10548:239-781(-)
MSPYTNLAATATALLLLLSVAVGSSVAHPLRGSQNLRRLKKNTGKSQSSSAPTTSPTTAAPTATASATPSVSPTTSPTPLASEAPSASPTDSPTPLESASPSASPTPNPTTSSPTSAPVAVVYDCFDNNPCISDALDGQFYFPHAEPDKFVQCGANASCYTMDCHDGLVWDQDVLTCVWP